MPADESLAGEWLVVARRERLEEEAPPPPPTTADLLIEASERLGWRTERTMRVAQALFEGGYITYPRTDSTRIAPRAADQARQVAAAIYGPHALAPQGEQGEGETLPHPAAGEAMFTQDAHEAIRPANPATRPESVPAGEERLLYRLVWARFLAAFLRPAKVQVVTLTLEKRE